MEAVAKPRVTLAEYEWLMAFEKVKAMKEGDKLGEYEITWISREPHPPWLQVKNKAGKRMVRKCDPLLLEIISNAHAKGHENHFS